MIPSAVSIVRNTHMYVMRNTLNCARDHYPWPPSKVPIHAPPIRRVQTLPPLSARPYPPPHPPPSHQPPPPPNVRHSLHAPPPFRALRPSHPPLRPPPRRRPRLRPRADVPPPGHAPVPHRLPPQEWLRHHRDGVAHQAPPRQLPQPGL